MDLYNFVSLFGMVLLISVAWFFSSSRRDINWHVVIWGVGLQFLFAWMLFVFPAGTKVFLWINQAVVWLMDASSAGARFLFGPLSLPPGATDETGASSLGFILGFQVLPTIIFFSSLVSILYFYNIIPRVIKGFAYIFTKLMKVSGAESLCAASNIFVGVESALTVKPFLKDMTKSELCTVLSAGLATVSSNVLALYIFSLKNMFPNIAGHLVTASFLSAPAALAMSKVLLPETERPVTLGEHVHPYIEREDNVIVAVINGAHAGVKLIVGIAALLIAVLGLVALVDQGLGWLGGLINAWFHLELDWSLKGILGIMFYPFTLMVGVPLADAGVIAKVIGERAILTEVVAYQDLARLLAEGALTHPRSAVITTYVLCGFAHVASLAIFIGGISALVPEKTKVLAQVGLRSWFAATLACLLTGCVAGTFYTRGSMLLGY